MHSSPSSSIPGHARPARAFLLLAGAVLALVGAFSVPAAADAPIEFEVTFSYPDFNPCTGEDAEYTLTLHIREHRDHPNNFIGSTTGTGMGTDGYWLLHRTEHFQGIKNMSNLNLNEMWTDGTNTVGFHHTSKVDLRTGEVKVMRTDFVCLGG